MTREEPRVRAVKLPFRYEKLRQNRRNDDMRQQAAQLPEAHRNDNPSSLQTTSHHQPRPFHTRQSEANGIRKV